MTELECSKCGSNENTTLIERAPAYMLYEKDQVDEKFNKVLMVDLLVCSACDSAEPVPLDENEMTEKEDKVVEAFGPQ